MGVLEDAILCFQKYLFARDRKGQTLFREAEEWIFGETESDWLFSFPTVCDFLGTNPQYVRYGLRRWREKAEAQLLGAGGAKKMKRERIKSAA